MTKHKQPKRRNKEKKIAPGVLLVCVVSGGGRSPFVRGKRGLSSVDGSRSDDDDGRLGTNADRRFVYVPKEV